MHQKNTKSNKLKKEKYFWSVANKVNYYIHLEINWFKLLVSPVRKIKENKSFQLKQNYIFNKHLAFTEESLFFLTSE